MSENFSLSTQFEINKIEIDGRDVIGLFQSISLFENIYSPVITGSIVLLDTDASDFVSTYDIEGSEKIVLEFTNANDDTLSFEGDLNGLRNKVITGHKRVYTFDFTSEQVRKNEGTFITKRFKNKTPRDIIDEMVEKIGGDLDKVNGQGLPMSFNGNRKRPTEIIKYVLTHGVTGQSSASEGGDTNKEEETKGTTGFLCWQTLDGYRFSSVDEVLSGKGGDYVGQFTHQLQNQSLSMKQSMESIIDYDFKFIGNVQEKMRSGAFKNVVISFDMDKGAYKEFTYDDDKNMTKKQKEYSVDATRILWRPFSNEKFEQTCEQASKDQWDQSRQFLAQNTVRQNTFSDQKGSLTLPPRFEIKAGDTIQAKFPKVESENGGGYNEKHSGQYIIKQVGHHLSNDGRAYTKLSIVRSTIQQDDATSRKS